MQTLAQDAVAVVDDDAAVCDSLRFLLETAGHRVETYGSGTEFLARADPAHLACVVVDEHMPGLTGLGLTEQLRSRGFRTPVLLITGASVAPIAPRAASLGVRVFEKPLLGDDILACIRTGADTPGIGP